MPNVVKRTTSGSQPNPELRLARTFYRSRRSRTSAPIVERRIRSPFQRPFRGLERTSENARARPWNADRHQTVERDITVPRDRRKRYELTQHGIGRIAVVHDSKHHFSTLIARKIKNGWGERRKIGRKNLESSITWAGITLPLPLAAALIGATSAAVVSLLTLLISTWIAGSRFKEQLTHDRTQKNEDRKAAIRREVYLTAVAETQSVFAEIGGLVARDLSGNPAHGVLNAFMVALSKVTLVADAPAALLAKELTACVNEWFFKVLPLAFEHHLAKADIPRYQDQLKTAQDEQKRIAIEVAHSWEKALSDELIERLLKSDERFGEMASRARKFIEEAEAKTTPLRNRLANELIDSGDNCRETFMRLIAALRKEIHLDPLEIELLNRIAEDRSRVEKVFREIGIR